MLVRNWMNTKVITASVDDTMLDAMKLLKECKIRHLPILDEGRLVGIVTDRDLKRASASDATTLEAHELLYLVANIKLSEIMTKNPITVPMDFTVEEAAELLLQHRISGMPVMDHSGKVVGTITQADLFRVLISLAGVEKRGIHFAFLLEDRPGSIKEVADVIRRHGGRMASILTSYERAPEGYRHVYIRMYGVERPTLPNIKTEFGDILKGKAKLLYMVDHRDNKREIYDS